MKQVREVYRLTGGRTVLAEQAIQYIAGNLISSVTAAKREGRAAAVAVDERGDSKRSSERIANEPSDSVTFLDRTDLFLGWRCIGDALVWCGVVWCCVTGDVALLSGSGGLVSWSGIT